MGQRLTNEMKNAILRNVLGVVSIALISIGIGLEYSIPAGMITCGGLLYIELTTEAFYARYASRPIQPKRPN